MEVLKLYVIRTGMTFGYTGTWINDQPYGIHYNLNNKFSDIVYDINNFFCVKKYKFNEKNTTNKLSHLWYCMLYPGLYVRTISWCHGTMQIRHDYINHIYGSCIIKRYKDLLIISIDDSSIGNLKSINVYIIL